MIMKLGMEKYVLKLYKVYINDIPELTMSHFTTISNSAKLVFVRRRPRYEVSVYRTNFLLKKCEKLFVLKLCNAKACHIFQRTPEREVGGSIPTRVAVLYP